MKKGGLFLALIVSILLIALTFAVTLNVSDNLPISGVLGIDTVSISYSGSDSGLFYSFLDFNGDLLTWLRFDNGNVTGKFGNASELKAGDVDETFDLGENYSISFWINNSLDNYTWKDVSIGVSHACVLKDSGKVYCLGRGDNGQLGDGDATTMDRIGKAVGNYIFESISSGSDFSCGLLKNGTGLCWGYGWNGRLGDGDNSANYIPTPIAGNYNFSYISTAYEHACGILQNGSAMCWGYNYNGELGIGNTDESDIPVYVLGGYNFSSISLGSAHTCGILQNGSAVCWGDNYRGELGTGDTEDKYSPVFVQGNYNFSSISLGMSHTCGLLVDGLVLCWGDGSEGQLGSGFVYGSNNPIPVAGGYNFSSISSGSYHSCGVLLDGSTMCWGKGTVGQVGFGGREDKGFPTSVLGGYNFSKISLGFDSSCGVLVNGEIVCWGESNYNKLGIGSITKMKSPEFVVDSFDFKELTFGYEHACGILQNGSAMCWGYGPYGQLGDDIGTTRLEPKLVVGNYSFTSIYEGWFHTCGLLENGSAMCWGYNNYGQLGDNSTTRKYIPTPVVGGYNFSSIGIGTYFSCGLLQNGSAMCWGSGSSGKLGTGGLSSEVSPVSVQGNYNFSSISVGQEHTCGLLQNGSAMCWGEGYAGRLGIEDMLDKSSPTFVNGGHTYSSIYAGMSHTCGILTDGSARCWGYNSYGELGNGFTTSTPFPTPVSGGYNFSSLFLNNYYYSTCGILQNGSAMCWGSNALGHLGDGTLLERDIPTPVSGNYRFEELSGGKENTCGRTVEGKYLCWGGDYNILDLIGGVRNIVPEKFFGFSLIGSDLNKFFIAHYSLENLLFYNRHIPYELSLSQGYNHILLNREGRGNATLYLNGQKEYTFEMKEGASNNVNLQTYNNVTLDELVVLNRYLSEDEVYALYNGSSFSKDYSGLTEGDSYYSVYGVNESGTLENHTKTFYVDFSFPAVEYESSTKANNTVISQDYIFVNLSVIEDSSFDVVFDLYNSTNLVNSTKVYNRTTSINWTGLAEENYYYNTSVIDSVNNTVATAQRKIILDTTPATIITNAPTPANNSGVLDTFIFNYTINDLNGLKEFEYTFDGSSETVALVEGNSSILSNTVFVDLTKLNESSWNVIINQTGIVSGVFYNYEIKLYDNADNMNTTGINTLFGNTGPSFTQNIYSPTGYSDLDPDTKLLFNFTVDDPEANLNSVKLQIKKSNETWVDASNFTADNYLTNGTKYYFNSSYQFDGTTEVDYTYRIIAEDDFSFITITPETNLAVYWDCDWEINSNLGAVAGWDENRDIGNITIVNFGDPEYTTDSCSLGFRMSHDLFSGRIYFNNWANNKWVKDYYTSIVPAQTNLTIPINATFLTEIKQEEVTIILEEVSSISLTPTITENLTVVSIKEGPYLYPSIAEAGLIVNLTNEDFDLTGTLRNLMGSQIFNQNNTAYNVSLNWNLPEGLVISSGQIALSFENISDEVSRNTAISLSPSGLESSSPGIKSVTLSARGKNYLGEDIVNSLNETVVEKSVDINFVCYTPKDGVYVKACGLQDGDYVAEVITLPGSNAGGGGGGGGSGDAFSKSEESFELLNGELKEFELVVKNKYAFTKKDISVSVSGDNSEYVIPEVKTIPEILPKKEFKLPIKISAPTYFSSGKYLLKFKFSGKLIDEDGKKMQSYTEEKYVTLYITDRTREQADIYLSEAQNYLEEMKNKNLSTNGASELLEKMNSSYSNVSFLEVEDAFSKLDLVYKSATGFNSQLKEIEDKLEWADKYGMDPMETKKLVLLANVVFERGDYVLAQKKLAEAISMYSYETKGELKLYYVIKNNKIQFLIVFIILVIVANMSYYFGKKQRLARKIKRLKHEEKLLLELMKSVQKETFSRGDISMNEYHDAMNQYEVHLSEVVQEKIKVESKLINFSNFRGKKKALFHERDKVIKLMQNLQKDYLKKGTVDTRVYNNLLKSHSLRLSKIEEEIAFMELKSFMSKSHMKEMKEKLNSKYPQSQKKERKKVIKKVKKKAKIEKLKKIKKSSKKGKGKK